MSEETAAAAVAPENEEVLGAEQPKTWYPYITKVQFEKFLARLQGKIPEQIDRDYVRAIIRTPSMIYRFLRGIEAMKLIDRSQHPTELLHRMVDKKTRSQAIAEVLNELYGELMEQRRQQGSMSDREIVEFFRQRTGMGSDSGNKMKMFFNYLAGEAELEAGDQAELPEPAPPPKAKRASSPRSAPAAQEPLQNDRYHGRSLSETQKAYLETLKAVLQINIDGDWDDDMIRLTFERLERLFDRIRRG